MSKCWVCKIGSLTELDLPPGSDLPMRMAIEEAYFKLTGKHPDGLFSGWGEEFSKAEAACITGDSDHLFDEAYRGRTYE